MKGVKQFLSLADENGLTILTSIVSHCDIELKQYFEPGTLDFSTEVQLLKDFSSRIILIFASVDDGANFLRQGNSQGLVVASLYFELISYNLDVQMICGSLLMLYTMFDYFPDDYDLIGPFKGLRLFYLQ